MITLPAVEEHAPGRRVYGVRDGGRLGLDAAVDLAARVGVDVVGAGGGDASSGARARTCAPRPPAPRARRPATSAASRGRRRPSRTRSSFSAFTTWSFPPAGRRRGGRGRPCRRPSSGVLAGRERERRDELLPVDGERRVERELAGRQRDLRAVRVGHRPVRLRGERRPARRRRAAARARSGSAAARASCPGSSGRGSVARSSRAARSRARPTAPCRRRVPSRGRRRRS